MDFRLHKRKLQNAVARLANARVGVVGDLVADVYISGQSDRVSREAPVLIVRYEREWLRPGGAANVAANLAALGATACLVGMVGDDDIGRKLLAQLQSPAVDDVTAIGEPARPRAGGPRDSSQLPSGSSPPGAVECSRILKTAGRATISKTRFLAGAKSTHRQQILRLDRQPTEPPDENLIAAICRAVLETDKHVDAWVASDYGYGSFNNALRDVLRHIARNKPVLADSRWELTQFSGLTLLKPNEEEAFAAARELNLPPCDEASLPGELASKLEARAVLVTLGNKGMVLSADSQVTRIGAVGTEEIVDLTGAGDSVIATLAAGVAAGIDFATAARLANHAGGIVVMKEGAATASPDELRESIEKYEE